MPAGDTIAELARLAASGDEVAFHRLVLEVTPTAYRIALHTVGSDANAQDVLQEAFVRVWKKLDTLREYDAVTGWICRIVRNIALDRIRASKRHPTVSISEGTVDTQGEVSRLSLSQNPELRLITAQREAVMQRAIGELKDKYRIVLLLRFVEGMSYEEIASAMSCPVGTIESRLHRARRSLGEKMTRIEKRRQREEAK